MHCCILGSKNGLLHSSGAVSRTRNVKKAALGILSYVAQGFSAYLKSIWSTPQGARMWVLTSQLLKSGKEKLRCVYAHHKQCPSGNFPFARTEGKKSNCQTKKIKILSWAPDEPAV
jgi:hypothetical protein